MGDWLRRSARRIAMLTELGVLVHNETDVGCLLNSRMIMTFVISVMALISGGYHVVCLAIQEGHRHFDADRNSNVLQDIFEFSWCLYISHWLGLMGLIYSTVNLRFICWIPLPLISVIQCVYRSGDCKPVNVKQLLDGQGPTIVVNGFIIDGMWFHRRKKIIMRCTGRITGDLEGNFATS